MKRLFIISSLLLSALYAFGQSASPEKLELQIKQHPQQDTFRVNRMIELSKTATTLSAGRLDTMGTEVLSVSQKLDYPEGQVYGLIMLSRVKYLKNDAAQSLIMKQQAAAIAEKITDKTHLTNVLLSISTLKNNIGESKAALAYDLKAEAVAETTQNKSLISRCQDGIAGLYANAFGDYAKAMEWALKAEKNAEDANDLDMQAQVWSEIAGIYTSIGDTKRSLIYYKKALDANKKIGNKALEYNLLNRIGEMYRLSGNYAEAIKAYQQGLDRTRDPYSIELTQSNMADVYVRQGNLPLAFKYAFQSLYSAKKINDQEGEEWIDGILGRAYLKLNKPDSALYYASHGYNEALHTSTIEFKRDNCEALANAYVQKKDFSNAYKFQNLYVTYRDSMSSADVSNQANILQYNYDLAKKQAQIATLNQDKKAQQYFLTGSFIVIVLVIITVIILLNNNRQKQKANNLLSKQKQIIEEQRDQTNKALADLQLTQKQLIQSEKMASLGELTAGVAHEIQNPLNFVNNFAEVSVELLNELKEGPLQQLTSSAKKEANEIVDDITENLQKINHHGKRADSIVKGMLQHSRNSSGQKELTDINVLADEYLRLSFHGLRAKDKTFNATMDTHFDETLPKISVMQQDVGRVLLNLFTNAFYSVTAKKKAVGEGYEPTITVTTKKSGNYIEVTVRDNGMGIAQKILDKIYQPFFTTKPTGQGTGLGLSMSYDIVKAHEGELNVKTVEGEFAEFSIKLPLS